MADQEQVQRRIARVINVLREARGISTQELYARAGLKKQSYFDRMNGTTGLTVTELENIAAALGVDPCALLRDPDELVRQWVARDSNPEPADVAAIVAAA